MFSDKLYSYLKTNTRPHLVAPGPGLHFFTGSYVSCFNKETVRLSGIWVSLLTWILIARVHKCPGIPISPGYWLHSTPMHAHVQFILPIYVDRYLNN